MMEKNDFFEKLSKDLIKINCNENPIKMSDFLQFLTVDVVLSNNNPGIYNGWTERRNDNLNLIIGGGIVKGIDYLNTIQYGKNLHNKYNNYVNPFYLLDILNDDGKAFFVNYYKTEIEKIIQKEKDGLNIALRKVELQTEKINRYNSIYKNLQQPI